MFVINEHVCTKSRLFSFRSQNVNTMPLSADSNSSNALHSDWNKKTKRIGRKKSGFSLSKRNAIWTYVVRGYLHRVERLSDKFYEASHVTVHSQFYVYSLIVQANYGVKRHCTGKTVFLLSYSLSTTVWCLSLKRPDVAFYTHGKVIRTYVYVSRWFSPTLITSKMNSKSHWSVPGFEPLT